MLESVLALAVLAFIVWWTFPRRRRPAVDEEERP